MGLMNHYHDTGDIRVPAGRAWNVVPDAVRGGYRAELFTFLRVTRSEIPSLCTAMGRARSHANQRRRDDVLASSIAVRLQD